LQSEWNKKLVTKRAETYLDLRKIDHITASRGERLENYLGEGYRGAQVRLLQRLLAKNGYFPEDKINGNFGPLTKKSVLNYQLSHGIVKRSSDPGAGYVGPSTMNALRGEQKMEYFGVVRGEGWNAL